MLSRIPPGYRPIILVIALFLLGSGAMFLADLTGLWEPGVTDCCANGAELP